MGSNFALRQVLECKEVVAWQLTVSWTEFGATGDHLIASMHDRASFKPRDYKKFENDLPRHD